MRTKSQMLYDDIEEYAEMTDTEKQIHYLEILAEAIIDIRDLLSTSQE